MFSLFDQMQHAQLKCKHITALIHKDLCRLTSLPVGWGAYMLFTL